MKYYFYLVVILLTGSMPVVYGQQLRISGNVISAEGQQFIQGVTVRIPGIGNRVSDEQGRFTFENLPAGSYTVTFSYLGYETRRITLALPSTEGGNLSVELTAVSDRP